MAEVRRRDPTDGSERNHRYRTRILSGHRRTCASERPGHTRPGFCSDQHQPTECPAEHSEDDSEPRETLEVPDRPTADRARPAPEDQPDHVFRLHVRPARGCLSLPDAVPFQPRPHSNAQSSQRSSAAVASLSDLVAGDLRAVVVPIDDRRRIVARGHRCRPEVTGHLDHLVGIDRCAHRRRRSSRGAPQT